MDQLARKATAAVIAIAALGSTSACSNRLQASRENDVASTSLATAPPPSLLVSQQLVDQEKRCFYSGENGEFYISVERTESCPVQYAHAGQQWDAANRRF